MKVIHLPDYIKLLSIIKLLLIKYNAREYMQLIKNIFVCGYIFI